MADTLAATISTTIKWLYQSPQPLTIVVGNSQLAFTGSLAAGTGNSQVDQKWEAAGSLLTSTSVTWDLTAVTQTIFGSTVTFNFTNIKAIGIVNTNSVSGDDLTLGVGASNGFAAPFAAVSTGGISVPAGSSALLTNLIPGWTVDSTHKTLKLNNATGDTVAYQIIIIGV